MAPARDASPLVIVPTVEEDDDLRLAREVIGDAGHVEGLAQSGPERRRQLESARALLVFAWRLKDEEIALLNNTSLVQSVWAGVDRLPVERIHGHDPRIQIASGSGPNAVQVAEHAIGLYLDCAKRITLRDRGMRQGGWPQWLESRRIAGSRIAVVGLGAIGSRVAKLLSALDAEVTAVTRTGRLDHSKPSPGLEPTSLEGLRARLADHSGVILCLPLTENTRGVVDRAFLQAMPEDGILVNIARGKIVDEDALFDHLSTHPRFMAGLDVWWRYPKQGEPRPQNHPFETLENVVMTPHSAFNIPGTRQDMIRHAAANVARALRGESIHNRVSRTA